LSFVLGLIETEAAIGLAHAIKRLAGSSKARARRFLICDQSMVEM
jgi:hypothetical protein